MEFKIMIHHKLSFKKLGNSMLYPCNMTWITLSAYYVCFETKLDHVDIKDRLFWNSNIGFVGWYKHS